jgi:hypothetical protein
MTSDFGSGGGTSVGSGPNSIERATIGCVEAEAVAGVEEAVVLLVLLIKAQPPIVEASEAAVISSLTPGAPEAGRAVALEFDMRISPVRWRVS